MLALSFQKVHRGNNASGDSASGQDILLSQVDLELLREDVVDGRDIVLLAKTAAISVDRFVLRFAQEVRSDLRQLRRGRNLSIHHSIHQIDHNLTVNHL